MKTSRRYELKTLKERHSQLEHSKWSWAAPLLEHPWAIRMTMAWIAVAVLAAAVSWWLLVPVTDWLAHHDVGSASGSLLQTARDAARGRLLTLGAGLFAAGVLVYTARTFALSRQGQVTDRYTKAIEQLGSDKTDVRIGGIYALERVARDSKRDHPVVMEMLAAFVRVHSRGQSPLPEPGGADPLGLTRPDVQAALTVIGAGFHFATSKAGPLTLPTRSSLARTSPTRTSPVPISLARSSLPPSGPRMRQFPRAGNATPLPAG
jgi:hypothetical protein